MKLLSSRVFLAAALMASIHICAQASNDRPFGERSILSKTATAERLAPVAKVCIEGESCGSKAVAQIVVAAAEPLTGEKTYQAHCAMCHAAGAAGAPKLGDAEAWKVRLAAAGSIDKLAASAVAGKNAMPAKGLCMECNDGDIKNAVQYMLDHSK